MEKLFTPHVANLGRPDVAPEPDAVDVSFAEGTPEPLSSDLVEILGEEQVLSRVTDLVRYASDASQYRYIPQVVVRPKSVDNVQALFRYCRDNGRHATFRSGGTSINGQAQSDDILVDVRHDWSGWEVLDDGLRFKSRTGTLLGRANQALARYQRQLGPDPASAQAATLGGVISNNSGGMRCGVERDSYHTVESMTVVLPSGTVIDTAAPDADEQLARKEPALAKGLMEIRTEMLSDADFAERIRRKYSYRNTNGYSLNTFIDADTPVDILRRLMVRSEGTLGFVSEVVFKTLPKPRMTCVTWLPFASVGAAVAVVNTLVGLGAEAVELMVASNLTTAANSFQDTPSYWKTLDPQAAALLVELGASSVIELNELEQKVAAELTVAPTLQPLQFIRNREAIELAWHVREGLWGLIGRGRPGGTSFLTEDVCFPPSRLEEGVKDLTDLLQKFGSEPAVIGHAAYGDLHFVLLLNLALDEDRKRYAAFIEEMTILVVEKYDGSLKAEHGTGLNMAPFIRREWGEKATAMMWRIKELFDPHKILAPNVILSNDPDIGMKNLKSVPAIEDISSASHCAECGFCEPVCPSRNVTVTPRQRIVLRREMARQPEWSAHLQKMLEEYEYSGIESCAVDGTCADICPIQINTGALMKHFRRIEHGPLAEEAALEIAKNWKTVEQLARVSVGAADLTQKLVGTSFLSAITDVVRSVVSTDLAPSVPGPMPHPAPADLPLTERGGAFAAYFPACVTRIF